MTPPSAVRSAIMVKMPRQQEHKRRARGKLEDSGDAFGIDAA